jgi:hypothetical protein
MTKDKALRLALEALESNRRTHHYCEDTWYSCPKHEDGCANDSEGDECNCGTDKANAGIDQAIAAIKAALEAKVEPVQTIPNFDQLQQIVNNLQHCFTRDSKHEFLRVWIRDWTEHKLSKHTPPQRKPLTDEEIKALDYSGTRIEFVRAIEAAHGIAGEKPNAT